MKYIDADILSERIKKNQYVIEPMFLKGDDSYYEGENDGYNRILDIIDSLQQEQPSLPDNLDKAARLYAIPHYMKDVDVNYLEEYPYDKIAEAGFIAGAQWMENQFEHCGSFPVEDPNGGYWPTDYYVKKK